MTVYFSESGQRSETDSAARLERFRWLLARYQYVWHFAPPKDRFIELWKASDSAAATQAEAQRLNGG